MTTESFWSGETLTERLAGLIEPFSPERIDCAACTLAVGPEVYVSPNDQTVDPTTVTVRMLVDGEAFTIPPGAVRFPFDGGGRVGTGGRDRLHIDPSQD